MCGKAPKAPKVVQQQVVQRDPVAEQAEAERKAAVEANVERAATRRRRQRSSLLTTGRAGSTTPASTLLATAKPVTGGG